MIRFKTAISATVMLIGFIASGGCSRDASSGTPGKPKEHWPPNMSDLHFAWSADPGIDLLTGAAVVSRAYIESTLLVTFGGSMDYLYPGFDHAVAPNQPVGSPSSTIALWPEPGKADRTMAGTAFVHIVRIERSGRDVTAVACRWTYGSAWQQPNGMYRIQTPNTGPATGLLMERLNLEAPADPSSDLRSPQKGPSPYPMTDVFGKWRVVGSLQAFGEGDAGPEWPEFNQDMGACTAQAPASIERREYLTSADRPRTDFPTLPAAPGWPAQSQ